MNWKFFDFFPSKTHHYLCLLLGSSPPPFHYSLPSFSFLFLSFIQSQMAAPVLLFCENDNMENIPPFSSENPKYVLTKSSSPTNKKRMVRKPLEDITNLILPQIYSTLTQSNTTIVVSSQALVYQSRCRKRRAEDGLESISKKIHLVCKSINFR